MVTTMNSSEQIETLEDVLELFDQAAEHLRMLHNPRIEAYASRRSRARGAAGSAASPATSWRTCCRPSATRSRAMAPEGAPT
jgi:hypothetical protein